MADLSKAFTVPPDGLSLNDLNGVFSSVDDPSVAPGFEAPRGSLLNHTPVAGNGATWHKFGDGDTDWHQLDLSASLQGEPTGFPTTYEADATMSFVDGTLTFTIAPTGADFSFYTAGRKYTVSSADSIIIDDTSGYHYIYYLNGVLTSSLTRWTYDPVTFPATFVSAIYWNASTGKHSVFAEERHGYVMDWATHLRFHVISNLQLINPIANILPYDYILRGDGSSDVQVKFAMTEGTLVDEDLFYSVVDKASPADPFEQTLSPYIKLPVLYLTTGRIWAVKSTIDDIPLMPDPGNTVFYNKFTAPDTFALTNVTEEYFVNMWLTAVNDFEYPLKIIVGTDQYASVAGANTGAPDELSLMSDSIRELEALQLYRFIYRSSAAYTNTPKAILYALASTLVPVITEDRFPIVSNYNGNAGTGKYLNFFPGQSSDDSPWTFTDDTFIRTIIVNCSSSSTGVLGVFNVTDLVTPVVTVTLTAETSKRLDLSQFFNSGDQIAMRVTSGSLSKPGVQTVAQTS
jgi:hypothetical protein